MVASLRHFLARPAIGQLRALLTPFALAGLVVPAALQLPHPGTLPPGHPSANISPAPDFTQTCAANTFDNSAACAQAVVTATNAARIDEGVGPLHFSLTKFLRQSRPVQLFVITNLERLDRGLPVFTTLSNHLDAIAAAGARARTDPSITAAHAKIPGGAQVVTWAANLASNTYNALASNYVWMYEDGPGSANVDCPSGGGPGCWAHRFNMLGKFPKSISDCGRLAVQRSMGAATTTSGSPRLPALATIYVAACGHADTDAVTTWAKAEVAVGI